MADEAKKPARAPKAPKAEGEAPKPKAAKKEAAPKAEAPAEPKVKVKKEKRAKAPRPKLAPIEERYAAMAQAFHKPGAKPPKAAKKVKVTQIGSPIGREDYQLATLKGLGLNKRHRSRVLEDTPAVRGMIARVHHLVRVESAS